MTLCVASLISKYVASYILSKWHDIVKWQILRIMTSKHMKIYMEIKRINETKNETKRIDKLNLKTHNTETKRNKMKCQVSKWSRYSPRLNLGFAGSRLVTRRLLILHMTPSQLHKWVLSFQEINACGSKLIAFLNSSSDSSFFWQLRSSQTEITN
jgi:hypothetical protein